MKFRYHWIVFLTVAVLFAGCATKKDFQRLENKVDLLIQATKRSILDELFGEQSTQIAQLVDDLDLKQKQEFENLQQEYARGTTNIEDVRQKMLGVLGNNNRVVSTRRGIYVRNTEGDKLKAIPNDTKIVNCHLMDKASVPAAIQDKDVLNRFSWGQGELNGKTILFPWELTISSFTKEVAEHTARRTAQEFIINEALRWHISIFNNKSSPVPPRWWGAVEDFIKKMGYRFVINYLTLPSTVKAGQNLNIESEWENLGVAPPYRNYKIAFKLIAKNRRPSSVPIADPDYDLDLRDWLPGSHILELDLKIPGDIKPGRYNLAVALLDVHTGEVAVKLAIKGLDANGWYNLSELEVK